MKRRVVSAMTLMLLLTSMLMLGFHVQPVHGVTITVPDDYPTIQEAVNAASENDTIFVRNGTYENVVVVKAVSLVGENAQGTVIDGGGSGSVVMISANNVNVSGFTIRNSGTDSAGIRLESAIHFNINIVGNNITSNYSGIWFDSSSNSSVSGNNITKNGYYGVYLGFSSNYNTVSGNTITNNGYGVYLEYSSNYNTVSGNNITANKNDGIWLDSASYNSIYGNDVTATSEDGISLNDFSNYNKIVGNTVANNNIGIGAASSGNNTISGNNVSSNSYVGIRLHYSDSNKNVVSGNIVSNDNYGIFLASSTNNNMIWGNKIADNNYGIYLSDTGSNMFFHNNFVGNTQQVVCHNSTNLWDDGYPSGGNYWSDHAGVDVKSGPNQNMTGSDGIGDIPYVIDADNQDRYPLMHPWSPLPVHNINTGLGYAIIQEAINANETINGHAIFVDAGIYYENVVVNKSLILIGENREATIIDGNGSGDAVTVLSNGTCLSSFTLQAPGFMNRALRLENVSSTTVVNNTLTNSFSSILLAFSDFNTISDNNIAAGNYYSIFHNSSHNTLTRNSIGGLRFSGSFNNTLVENAIGAFWLDFSPNAKLRDNNFSYFEVGGDMDLHFIQDIGSSNMLNEKPIYYWVNRENAEVPSDAGYVALINCLNITVRGSNFGNNFQSILMFSTNNSWILNNNVTSNNNVTNSNEGIWISSSSNNIIYGNSIVNNGFGIQLLNGCSNNNIHGNNITANGLGIWLVRSSNNKIFHNNFINNGVQVDSYKSTNTWDDGHPSGGNYWSNYTGVDADWDGVGDTFHTIDVNNTDRYPLIAPITIFDAGTWNGAAYNVDVVSNSTVSNCQVDASQKTISFKVSGLEFTAGFCRVTIPNVIVQDLWHRNYTVLLNGEPSPFRNWTDSTNTYIYINYTHSQQEIVIVPEFPSSLVLPLFIIATLLAVIVYRRTGRESLV